MVSSDDFQRFRNKDSHNRRIQFEAFFFSQEIKTNVLFANSYKVTVYTRIQNRKITFKDMILEKFLFHCFVYYIITIRAECVGLRINTFVINTTKLIRVGGLDQGYNFRADQCNSRNAPLLFASTKAREPDEQNGGLASSRNVSCFSLTQKASKRNE